MQNNIMAGHWLALFLVAFSACQNDASKNNPPEHATEHQTNTEVKPQTYQVRFLAPTDLQAGALATLNFSPKIKGAEAEAVPLSLQHEKKIHLIITSEDLAFFEHIHPKMQADGSYSVQTIFPNGGKYLLFADYKPTGATPQLEQITQDVQGKSRPNQSWSTPKTTANAADGYSVSLNPEIGKFVDKGETHIMVQVMKNGKEIMASELENYLGAKGHAIVISTDAEKRYLHLHPGVEQNRVHLTASFGKTGIYRTWFQFKHEGKIQTLDFVLNVVEGTGEFPENEHQGHTH